MGNTKIKNMPRTLEEGAAYFQKEIKNSFIDYLGIQFLKWKTGYCLASLKIQPHLLNPLASLHGGVYYSIADTIGGICCIHLDADTTVTTINGSMNYLRPVLDTDTIFAEAIMIKDGKRVAYADVTIQSEDGTVFAKGTFSFARIPTPQALLDKRGDLE